MQCSEVGEGKELWVKASGDRRCDVLGINRQRRGRCRGVFEAVALILLSSADRSAQRSTDERLAKAEGRGKNAVVQELYPSIGADSKLGTTKR